jgi:hypothetical protein
VSLLLTLALAVPAPPQVLAVRLATVDGRATLHVLTVPAAAPPRIERHGPELRVEVAAEAAPGLTLPTPMAPVSSIGLDRSAGRIVLRLLVPLDVPYDLRVQDGVASLVFGAPSAETAPPSVADLYSQLFPVAPQPLIFEETDEEGRGRAKAAESAAPFHVGRVGLRPYLTASYIDADTVTGDPPRVARDSYLQIQPGLAADAPLGLGQITVSYEPRLREFSSVPEVQQTTHWLNASLNLPVGPRLTLGATSHYSKGILEATEVDPGGEYFFDLGPYERLDLGASAQIEVSPRLRLDLGADVSGIEVADEAAFFSHDGQALRAALSYELGRNARSAFGYAWTHIPRPPDRPQAEATAHSVTFELTGEVLPLTTGRINVAYAQQDTPNAGPGGQSYRGLTAGVGLRRQLGYQTAIDLNFRRNLLPSAFQDDGFYIATLADAVVTFVGPFEMTLRIGAGHQWSDYRTDAAGFGGAPVDGPRADRIFAWYAGLSRGFGDHISLRADYRRDQRRSNIPEFQLNTDAIVVQLGLGWFGGGGR